MHIHWQYTHLIYIVQDHDGSEVELGPGINLSERLKELNQYVMDDLLEVVMFINRRLLR